MSEYMEKFAVSRLTGAPPGYVGYEVRKSDLLSHLEGLLSYELATGGWATHRASSKAALLRAALR